MEELINIKIVAVFVLLFIALVFGVLPILFIVHSSSFQDPERKSLLQRVISCLNAFAGGVFMGISLMHLLPDVRTLIQDAFKEKGDAYNFNWAELCVACGFFMVVFVEQMVQLCQEKLINGLSEEEIPFASQETYYGDKEESVLKTTFAGDEVILHDSGPEGTEFESNDLRKRKSSISSDKSVGTSASTVSRKPATFEEIAFEQGHLTAGRAMILLISLSLHSVFEGLALGLQLTKKGLTDIFIAISLHKGIEAFTIAVGLAQINSTQKLKFLSTILFACMSPIGIAIGIPIAISSKNDTEEGSSAQGKLINGILQGLATGTFMFVTFIEILPHELNSRKDAFIKFFFIILGFTAITLLNALE